LQSTFASALHSPVQLAPHLASHEALGGVAAHCPSQLAPQAAWHCASQAALVPPVTGDVAQLAWQVPSQSAEHCPWHVNVPGSALHCAEQLPSQLTLQDRGVTLHCPSHAAESCTSQ
jgi:hypothetical protein